MRTLSIFFVILASVVTAPGCEQPKNVNKGAQGYHGETIEAITGQVVQDGKPISLSKDSVVELKLMFKGDGGQTFDSELSPDGSFARTLVAVGRYKGFLTIPAKQKGETRRIYAISQEVVIEQGKTHYTVEVGKDWISP